jgi:hypothetical protein
VFGRDRALPITFMAEWGEIEQQCQKEMAPSNRTENSSRINHDYKEGDKVLLKNPGKHLRKLEAPKTGPHTVITIYTNGTLLIQKGMVNERANMSIFFYSYRSS